MIKILAVISLLWSMVATAAVAADPWEALAAPLFGHLQGLPHPVALALAQDRDGFIWLGTPGGLARWDGYRLRVYRHDDSDPGSPPEDIISQLSADPRGGLWLGTVTGLVAYYDPVRESFTTYRDEQSPLARILAMASDGEGGVWVAGRNGFAHWTAGAWHHETAAANALPSSPIKAILQDRQGTLWIGAGTGLMRRRAGSVRFEALRTENDTPLAVTALHEDRGGVLWFGTAGGQIGRVDADRLRLDPALASSNNSVSRIAESEEGTLWIGLYGGGLRELHPADGTSRVLRHDPAAADGPVDDFVTDLLIDRSGLLWVGSLGGVDRHDPGNHQVATILPGGLPGKDVRSMTVRPDGKVWLGFLTDGIALFDPAAGRVAALGEPRKSGDAPPIQAIAAADGEVWAGSLHGLYRIDPATGLMTRFEALGDVNVTALLGEGSRLWVGGTLGLAELDEKDGRPRLYRHDPADPDSLSDNAVGVVFRDRRRRLWAGTQRGLNLFYPDRGKFQVFLHDPKASDSLPNDVVNSLLQDRQGRLWVATQGGIGILDPDMPGPAHFRNLRMGDGLPSDHVVALQEDSQGRIWASTFDGMAVIDPVSLSIRPYLQAEGVRIRTHWANSAARLPDGTLLFGGFGGMTAIRPDRPASWDFRPPLAVTDLRIGGRRVAAGKRIELDPGDRNLQVEFSALDFSAPERNLYAYRLTGFDADWVAADAEHRIAAYTNLPPGHYLLSIRGSNRNGLWSETPLTLPVDVLPAWYQTAWFRFCAALAAIAALAGMVRARTAYLHRSQQRLERLVAEQTVELAAAHHRALAGEDEARRAQEAAEAANLAKSRLLAVVSHEIRTPLNGVLALAQMLDPQQLTGKQRRYLAIAENSGETLRSLIDSILDYQRLGTVGETLRIGTIDPRRLVGEAVELFRPQAEAQQIALDLSIAADVPPLLRGDPVRLHRVLLNLIGNAVKFTAKGSVRVAVGFSPAIEGAGDMLTIDVADTGIGIAPEMQKAIFDDFVQADDSIALQFGGTGLGLAICRRIVDMMRGSLTVESAVGAGSIFRLRLPAEPGLAEPAASPIQINGPTLNILVVDDDEINRSVAAGLLGSLGHRVTQAADGAAAEAAVAADDFDAVMVDLHMPVMDGIEVAGRIRAMPDRGRTGPRILAMTADLTEEARQRCSAAGINEVIGKPLRVETLRRVLDGSGGETFAAAPRPIRPGAAALLDEAYLAEQLDTLGAPELIRLTRLFHRASRQMIASMEAAAAGGDRSAVSADAHRLASAASAVGLAGLAGLATSIEENGEADPTGQLAALVSVRRASLAALAVIARRPASVGDQADR